MLNRETIMLNGLTGLDEKLTLTMSVSDKSEQYAGFSQPSMLRRRYFVSRGKVYLFEVLTPQTVYDAAPEAFGTKAKTFFDSIELPKEDASNGQRIE